MLQRLPMLAFLANRCISHCVY